MARIVAASEACGSARYAVYTTQGKAAAQRLSLPLPQVYSRLKATSTLEQRRARGKPRWGMRSNVDVYPRRENLPLFGLRPNKRYPLGVGTSKRIIHWLGEWQHLASCCNQGICSRMPRLSLPRLCSCADVDAPTCLRVPRLSLPRLCSRADVDTP